MPAFLGSKKGICLFSVLFILFIFNALHVKAKCGSGTDSFTVASQRCTGSSITFTNYSTSADSFIWIWGDATSNTIVTSTNAQTHAYSTAGTYTVKLIRVITSPACKDTFALSVSVTDKPTVAFTFSPNNDCSGKEISFTNSSTGTGLTYSWKFGDGKTSTSTNPKHTYDAYGVGTDSFKVELTATSSSGCGNTLSKYIKVKQRPNPELYETSNFKKCHSKVTGTDTFQVDITNTTDTAGITGYSIDWGDGTSSKSYGKSFTTDVHTYKKLGTFSLVITATGKNGCSGSTTYKVTNEANPVAGIIGPPSGTNEGCRPLRVRFINNSSDVSPGTTFTWDFGDGSAKVTWDASKAKDTIYHVFDTSSCNTTNGQFTVTLTAKNECRSSTTTWNPVIVTEKPKAKFSFTNYQCAPKSVSFSNSSTEDCNYGNQYSWDFGDPTSATNTSKIKNPNHLFSKAGTYTVTLVVKNQNCDGDTLNQQITLVDTPKADYSYVLKGTPNSSSCGPAIMTITNKSTGGNLSYSWSVSPSTGVTFESSTTSSSKDPVIKFTTAGTYSVKLTATNSCGSASKTQTIVVSSKPTIVLNNIADACGSLTYTPTVAYDDGGETITSYSWSFTGGSPSSSTSTNPSGIVYNSAGNYTVSVTATNSCGSTTVSKSFKINPVPDAKAGADKMICSGDSAQLGGSSVSGETYSWSPTKGLNKTNISNPKTGLTNTTSVNDTITYIVTVKNASGCEDKDTVKVVVFPKLNIDPGKNDTVCVSAPIFDMKGFSPTGGYWKGTGITDTAKGTFSPKTAGSGTHTLIYYYKDATTKCFTSATKKVMVNALPTVKAGTNDTFCKVNSNITLIGFSPTGGIWKGKGVSSAGVFNPATADTGVHTLTYIYTNGNGCKDSATKKVKVVIGATAEAGANDTVCVDASSFSLKGFSPTGGTWSGTGVSSSGTFNPSTAGAGTHTLTYSYGTGTCKSTDTKIVKVNALPTVSAGSNQSVCVSAAAFDINGFSPNGGWWKGKGITDTTKGTFNPGTAGTGTHTLTYYYKDATTGCQNKSTKTITVNTLPSVSAGANDTFCKANTNITLTGFSPSGGTWKGKGVTSSGVFNPNTADTGVHTLTYIYTDGNGCKDSATKKIKVVIGATAEAGANDTVCVDASSFSLKGFSPSGGTWSGTGVSSSGTFSPSTAGAGTHTLTYTYGTGTCESTDTKIVKVNALPTISAGSNQSICVSAAAFDMSGFSPSGGWWKGKGITDTAKGTFNPGTAGTGTHTLTYYYKDGTTGCQNKSTKTITVNTLPTVNAGANDTFCKSNVDITLTGFSPSGGTWKGKGVTSSGVFNPNTADTGVHTLTYIYTDGNGCKDSSTKKIKIVPAAAIDAGKNDTICIDNGVLTLTGYSPAGGTWSGTGVSADGKFNPATTGAGTFTLTYSYGASTCLVKATKIVKVNTLPTINAGADKEVCITEPEFSFSGYSPTGGTWSGTGITDAKTGKFKAANAGAGTYNIVYTYQDPNTKCINYDTLKITVRPLPVAGFSVDTLNCVGATVSFANTSSFATVYSWDFGDGKTSASANPDHIYTSAGKYLVKLTAQIIPGCADTVSTYIKIIDPPKSVFTTKPDSGCAPLNVSFENFSADEITSYLWNFGNGQTSNLKDPGTITFQQNDFTDTTYIVSFTVKNKCGTHISYDSVKVIPRPIAIIGTDKNSGCSPAKIKFSNKSVGKPTFFYWDFGNGKTSTLENPPPQNFITDSLDSVYTITFVAGNMCGTDTAKTQILVHPNTVTAFFNTSNFSGCVPFNVQFTDYSRGANFVSYDFGDGNISADKNPQHTFTKAGIYSVKQFANNGCSFDTTEAIITVRPQPDINFIFDPSPQCAREPVRFYNLSTDVADISWDFGDGNTSKLSSPVHNFAAAGKYAVTLTAQSKTWGCYSSFTDTVEIWQLPKPDFVQDPDQGCKPYMFKPKNTSTGKYFSWNFGDGNTSQLNEPLHIFKDTGRYTITLSVVDEKGCRDSVQKQIWVFPNPESNFSMSSQSVCDGPATVNFTNLSKGATGYLWDFGNGQTSTLNNPSAIYSKVGKYFIKLVSYNTFGCSDTFTTEYNIYPTPKAEFTFVPDKGCQPLTVQFTNQSIFGKQYIWDFGDGNTSTENDPQHTYEQPGTYNVSLKVVGDGGCENTIVKQNIIIVEPKPVAGFSYKIQNDPKLTGTVSFSSQTTFANKYFWDFGDGKTIEFSKDSTPVHRYDIFGNYTVTQVVETEFGCRDTQVQQITIDFFKGLFVPNAFTPNAGPDEISVFKPKGAGLRDYHVQVFTPWGELVWESIKLVNGQPAEGWDGTYQGKLCPQDVYVWKIQATFLDGSVWEGKLYENDDYKRVGSVTLVR